MAINMEMIEPTDAHGSETDAKTRNCLSKSISSFGCLSSMPSTLLLTIIASAFFTLQFCTSLLSLAENLFLYTLCVLSSLSLSPSCSTRPGKLMPVTQRDTYFMDKQNHRQTPALANGSKTHWHWPLPRAFLSMQSNNISSL